MLSSRGLLNGEYVSPSGSEVATPVNKSELYELDVDGFARSIPGRLGAGGGVGVLEDDSVDLRGGGGGGAFFAGEPDVVSRRTETGGGKDTGTRTAGEAGAGKPVTYLDERALSMHWTCMMLEESSSSLKLLLWMLSS